MRVTVCELPHRAHALAEAWKALVEHTVANASELVLLPEFAMAEPVWEFEQFDLSVAYSFNDNLTVSLEAINLTGEDVRWSARSHNQMVRLVDQSPRYMVGVRYQF